jgi:hypothetical protein
VSQWFPSIEAIMLRRCPGRGVAGDSQPRCTPPTSVHGEPSAGAAAGICRCPMTF